MKSKKQQVLDHIETLGPEGSAQFFFRSTDQKSINRIKTMRRTGNVTLDAYETLEAAGGPTVTNDTTVTNATYSSENPLVSNVRDDIAAEQEILNEKANDLHGRMQAMENTQGEILSLLKQVQTGQRGGNNLVRPQGQVYGQKVLDQIQQRPGIQSGIAPTREQANKSHEGPAGKLAHAAAPRVLQSDEPGTWNWNDTKDELKAKKEARLKRLANQAQA